MKSKKLLPLIISLALALGAAACDGAQNGQNAALSTFSGFISAREVRVAPEIGGAVAEVLVEEGQTVQAGDALLRLEDDVAQAQLQQAEAGVQAATAAVAAAEAQLAAAQLQFDLILQAAQLQDRQQRETAWLSAAAEDSELPVWYFQKDEKIAALQKEIQTASKALEEELANLEKTLNDASNQDFIQVEVRLSEAEAAMAVAEKTLQLAQAAQDNEELETAAEQIYDTAEAELKSAQIEYKRRLTGNAAENVLQARAEVAIARARLQTAQDKVTLLQTGDQSLQVQAAASSVRLAETAVQQALAGLNQAEAALRLAELQVEKAAVQAAQDGVVLAVNIKPGELLAAGSTALTIANLEQVELTVYIPEESYGRVRLGQQVTLRSDSFPERTFSGNVSQIADEAEFTPRNVQTIDGRKTTVYAVKISVPNPDHALKPGMPVDAEFNLN